MQEFSCSMKKEEYLHKGWLTCCPLPKKGAVPNSAMPWKQAR